LCNQEYLPEALKEEVFFEDTDLGVELDPEFDYGES
jgi:hypothetical protein